MKKFKLSFLFFTCFVLAKTQPNLTLYHMPDIHQSNMVNPATFSSRSINVGLPLISSFYLNYANTGFKFTDLLVKGADDSLHLDFDNLLSRLSDDNRINLSLNDNLLSAAVRFGNNYIHANVTEKVNIDFTYPKDFFEFAIKGNGALLGQQTSFEFNLNAMHYREYGIGYARRFLGKYTVGAKLKYLYGMENVYTQAMDISQYTDPNSFAISLTSNIKVNTSGIDSSSTADIIPVDYLFKKKNTGFGIDLGAVYDLTEKISISASIIDLGSITWRSGIENWVSKNPNSSFTFSGIELNGIENTNTDSLADKLLDSISDQFSLENTYESYKTMLPAQFYIGANYKVLPMLSVNALVYGKFYNKKLNPGITVGGSVNVRKFLSASLNYSIINKSYSNIGMGISLTTASQIYFVTDNILGFFMPQKTKNINARIGINIAVGGKDKKQKTSSFW